MLYLTIILVIFGLILLLILIVRLSLWLLNCSIYNHRNSDDNVDDVDIETGSSSALKSSKINGNAAKITKDEKAIKVKSKSKSNERPPTPVPKPDFLIENDDGQQVSDIELINDSEQQQQQQQQPEFRIISESHMNETTNIVIDSDQTNSDDQNNLISEVEQTENATPDSNDEITVKVNDDETNIVETVIEVPSKQSNDNQSQSIETESPLYAQIVKHKNDDSQNESLNEKVEPKSTETVHEYAVIEVAMIESSAEPESKESEPEIPKEPELPEPEAEQVSAAEPGPEDREQECAAEAENEPKLESEQEPKPKVAESEPAIESEQDQHQQRRESIQIVIETKEEKRNSIDADSKSLDEQELRRISKRNPAHRCICPYCSSTNLAATINSAAHDTQLSSINDEENEVLKRLDETLEEMERLNDSIEPMTQSNDNGSEKTDEDYTRELEEELLKIALEIHDRKQQQQKKEQRKQSIKSNDDNDEHETSTNDLKKCPLNHQSTTSLNSVDGNQYNDDDNIDEINKNRLSRYSSLIRDRIRVYEPNHPYHPRLVPNWVSMKLRQKLNLSSSPTPILPPPPPSSTISSSSSLIVADKRPKIAPKPMIIDSILKQSNGKNNNDNNDNNNEPPQCAIYAKVIDQIKQRGMTNLVDA